MHHGIVQVVISCVIGWMRTNKACCTCCMLFRLLCDPVQKNNLKLSHLRFWWQRVYATAATVKFPTFFFNGVSARPSVDVPCQQCRTKIRWNSRKIVTIWQCLFSCENFLVASQTPDLINGRSVNGRWSRMHKVWIAVAFEVRALCRSFPGEGKPIDRGPLLCTRSWDEETALLTWKNDWEWGELNHVVAKGEFIAINRGTIRYNYCSAAFPNSVEDTTLRFSPFLLS